MFNKVSDMFIILHKEINKIMHICLKVVFFDHAYSYTFQGC